MLVMCIMAISAIFTIRHSRRDIRGYAVYGGGGGGGYGGSYGGGYSSKKKSGGGFFARFKRNKGGTQSMYGGYGGDDDEDEGYGGYAGGGSAGAGSSYNSRYGSGTTGLRGASVLGGGGTSSFGTGTSSYGAGTSAFGGGGTTSLPMGGGGGGMGLMGGGLGVGGLGANSMMSGGLSGGKGTVTLAESNPGSVVALDPTVQLDTYGGSVSFHGQIETIQTMSTDMVSQVLNQPGQNRVLIIDGGGSRSDGTSLLDGTMAESAIRNGWKGVIVNGYVCDVARLQRTQLGVMALGTTPKKGLVGGGQQSIVIALGSTQVQNGWWVYADADGILLSQLDISGVSFGTSSGVGGSSMLTGGGFGGSSSMTSGGGLGGFGGASSSTMGFGGSSSMITGNGGLGGIGGASSSTMGFNGGASSMTGTGGLTGGYGSGSRVTGGYSAGSSYGGGGGMASRYGGTGGSSSYGGAYGGYGSTASNKKKHKKIFKMLLATSIAVVVWVVCLS